MNCNIYHALRCFWEALSQYKLANNSMNVMYGYMTPQQMIYDALKDEAFKHILFG